MEQTTKPPRIGVLGGDGAWSVAQVLRGAGLDPVDLEPAPKQVAEAVADRWHYGRASVRAGLLGHPRAALQLVTQGDPGKGWIWKGPDGLWLDGFRAGLDPEGMAKEAVTPYRLAHLAAVARLAGAVDRLILPLCTARAWVDGTGRVFAPRPRGVTLPTGVKLTEISFTVQEMQDDLAALAVHLKGQNPGLVLQVALLPALGEDLPGALAEVPGVAHDPVFDAVLTRVAAGGQGSALLAHLGRGQDLDAFGVAAPTPVAEEAPTDRDEKERRKRRKERRANRQAGAGKVVCEEELLEAFAK